MSTLALPLPTQKWLRRNWLAMVMLVAYVLLSTLILEQGRVIESQRSLIRELFSDSLQLNAMKVEKQQADQQAPPPPSQLAPQPELQK